MSRGQSDHKRNTDGLAAYRQKKKAEKLRREAACDTARSHKGMEIDSDDDTPSEIDYETKFDDIPCETKPNSNNSSNDNSNSQEQYKKKLRSAFATESLPTFLIEGPMLINGLNNFLTKINDRDVCFEI